MTVQTEIETRLAEALDPVRLEVANESHMHNVPPGSETHFKVLCVSAAFAEQSLVGRHRMVNGALRDLLRDRVHALALHTFTPAEWEARDAASPSPRCRGGETSADARGERGAT